MKYKIDTKLYIPVTDETYTVTNYDPTNDHYSIITQDSIRFKVSSSHLDISINSGLIYILDETEQTQSVTPVNSDLYCNCNNRNIVNRTLNMFTKLDERNNYMFCTNCKKEYI